ncbi:hypothetical protein ACQFZT_004465 [Providencia stuartii]|uniref:hypothetical protein n=1 Tax=Providencia TaxID=586 RepID=UPI00073BB160|nr:MULTISPECIES: hypothetical protein [Providencia]SST05382.1 Uncharacterised protein [Acinetobacter baumannii]KSX92404.1 hypothetical protein APT95_05005 [Providencia stuartii]MCX3070298.1 hypothetical protein [Providencia stuartii]MDT1068476.1 hypothetical protein [Providencia stuartii]MDT2017076.1 hypothetical protein [Providencia stuartii]
MIVKNIETADCEILNTEIYQDRMIITFSFVYDISRNSYVKDVSLIITKWSQFEAKIFISNGPNDVSKERKLSYQTLEYFENIQVISTDNDRLILQGFSKDSGHWLEYIFLNSVFYFKE